MWPIPISAILHLIDLHVAISGQIPIMTTSYLIDLAWPKVANPPPEPHRNSSHHTFLPHNMYDIHMQLSSSTLKRKPKLLQVLFYKHCFLIKFCINCISILFPSFCFIVLLFLYFVTKNHSFISFNFMHQINLIFIFSFIRIIFNSAATSLPEISDFINTDYPAEFSLRKPSSKKPCLLKQQH